MAVPDVLILQVEKRSELFIKKAMETSSPGLPLIPTRILISACMMLVTLPGDTGTHLTVSPNIVIDVPFL